MPKLDTSRSAVLVKKPVKFALFYKIIRILEFHLLGIINKDFFV
jgi:hypothetical protein